MGLFRSRKGFAYTDVTVSQRGILIKWAYDSLGFGELVIQPLNGRLHVVTGCRSEKFVSELLCVVAPKLAELLVKHDHEYPQTPEEIDEHIKWMEGRK